MSKTGNENQKFTRKICNNMNIFSNEYKTQFFPTEILLLKSSVITNSISFQFGIFIKYNNCNRDK